MKKVLVIDDDRMMKSYVEKFASDVEVEQLYAIPDDISVLRNYDAVVVDGRGIGNKAYPDGMSLCMAYDKPEGQAVVYHSGDGVFGKEAQPLIDRGVSIVLKGSHPEELSLAIQFAIERRK